MDKAPKTPPKRPGRTADRVLHEAARLFNEQGYEAASMRELAERLAITKASLYHHTPSKGDLLHKISTESLRLTTEKVATAWENAPAGERLRAMVQAHMASTMDNRDLFQVGLKELPSLPQEHRDEILRRRRDYTRMIEVAIKQDQADGRIRADKDPHLLTMTLLSLLNWSVFWYRTDIRGLSVNELADFFLSLFLEGAGTSKTREQAIDTGK